MRSTIIITTLIFLTACGGNKEEKTIEKSIRPVRYAQIGMSSDADVHTFSGTAQASEVTNLSFRVSGNIKGLKVKLGDRVRRGQLIATIDPADLNIQVEQAIAQGKGSEAQLKTSETQIKSAETQVKTSETQLITTRSNYERVEQLYENNSVPLSEYEQARANYETAKSQYEAALASKDAALAGLEASQTQVTTAEKQVQTARNQVNYTRLTAPFSGVITAVNVEANELVSAGNPIAVLSAEKEPEVNVGVPEIFISKIKKNQKVNLDFSVLPDRTFGGAVEEVAYAAGAAPTYPVIVRIKNPSKEIRPGMAANVHFDFSEKTSTPQEMLVAPVASVGEGTDGNFVFVLQKDGNNYRAKKQKVTIGKLMDKGFEIQSGLTSGNLVATAGLNSLLDGMEVKLSDK